VLIKFDFIKSENQLSVTIGETQCYYNSDGYQRTWLTCDSGHFKDCEGLDPQANDPEIYCGDGRRLLRGYYCEFEE
jgi:hypothetical protein